MTFRTRPLALLVLAVVAVSACRKKPETAVTGGPANTSAPGPTCDAACMRAKADSAAEAERRRLAALAADSAAAVAREMAALRATLSQTVLFEYDQAELSIEARSVLDAKLPILRANPGVRIRIAGHADERGSDEYNIALGQRRAVSVKRYLTDRGIDGQRIDVVSFGEERPAVTDGTEEGMRLNRRAEFEIIAGGNNLMMAK